MRTSCASPVEAGAKTAPPSGGTLLVLGLGNDILTDDAVGLFVTRELARRLGSVPQVEIAETCEMGLALLDYIVGHRGLILVDSVQTGKVPAGHLHEMEGCDLKVLPARTPHFLGVGETLVLGRMLGAEVPERVKVFAIEVEDPFTLGTELTPKLRQALPGIVDRILAVIQGWAPESAMRTTGPAQCPPDVRTTI